VKTARERQFNSDASQRILLILLCRQVAGRGNSSTDALKDATFVVPYQLVQCRLVELLKHVAESVLSPHPAPNLPP
jgi:hypothetical protein